MVQYICCTFAQEINQSMFQEGKKSTNKLINITIMEATIQQNNISANVSINIATFAANIQSALKTTKQRVLKELSLPRLYRKQLRLTMTAARTIEAHPTLTNIILILMCAMLAYEVLCYEFTTKL